MAKDDNSIAKLTIRTLGNPVDALKAMGEKDHRLVLGTICGEAVGISRRASADGERVDEGLKGIFEAVSTNKEIGTKVSSSFFAPAGMAENFLSIFRKDGAPSSLLIGLEVAIVRAANSSGYTHEVTPLVADTNSVDTLALARTKMAEAIAERNSKAKKK